MRLAHQKNSSTYTLPITNSETQLYHYWQVYNYSLKQHIISLTKKTCQSDLGPATERVRSYFGGWCGRIAGTVTPTHGARE